MTNYGRICDWVINGGDWQRTRYAQIARELKISKTAVYDLLPRVVCNLGKAVTPSVVQKIKRAHTPKGRPKIPFEKLERIKKKVDNGQNLHDIAYEEKLSLRTLQRYIQRYEDGDRITNQPVPPVSQPVPPVSQPVPPVSQLVSPTSQPVSPISQQQVGRQTVFNQNVDPNPTVKEAPDKISEKLKEMRQTPYTVDEGADAREKEKGIIDRLQRGTSFFKLPEVLGLNPGALMQVMDDMGLWIFTSPRIQSITKKG